MAQNMKTPGIRFKGFPDAWEQRKYSDLVKTRRGLTYKPSDISEQGVRVLRSSNIDEDVFRTKNDDVFVNKDAINIGYAKINDILITSANGSSRLVGKHALITGIADESTVHGGFMIIGTAEEPYFMNASMSSAWYRKFIELFVSGGNGAIGNLSKNDLDEQVILVPSKKEQQQIGTYFRNLDNLITLHQRKYDKLQNIKKSCLEKMFPEAGSNVPQIRFKGFTDAWEQRKLSDSVEFLDTMRKPLEGSKRISGPYPYYGASGIVDFVDGYLFDEELILLSEDGANITDRNYPVSFLITGKCWVNNHAHVLRSKRGYESNFICNSLERKDYTQYNTGMAMPKLNQEMCRNIPILCPQYAEQKRIGDYFYFLDNLITLHQREYKKLQDIKAACLEKMFI